MTRGKLKASLNLPKDFEGEIIATALRGSGWQNLSFNEMTNEITAEKKKTERKSGLNFNHEWRCHCSWWQEAQMQLLVEVFDEESNSSVRDCKNLCFEIIEGIESRAALVEHKIQTLAPRTTYGSDRFATEADLKGAGYTSTEVLGNGLLIAPLNGERLVIPQEEAYRHAMVCGPTGCGKTSSIFIPNLIEKIGVSALVTEATSGSEQPDLYAKTSGYRKAHGHNIYYFNPDDLTSIRINPVDFVTSLGKAQELAQLIMANTSQKFKQSGESKFWQDAEAHLLTALLLHVVSEQGSLASVRALIRKGPQTLGEIVSKSGYEQASQEYEAYLRVSTENIRNGVMCGLMQRLNNWINPRVVALTSKSDIDVTALPEELFTFYMAVPSDKHGLKPVAALVLNYVLNALKDADKERYKHPLALVLDEFTNFGYLPDLPTAMSIIRHQEIPVILGCQDYSQIKIEYGEDDTKRIFNNSATRIIFRTNDLPTAKSISESLGEQTVFERKLNTSCQVIEKEVGRPLMRPSEVMALDKAVSIVFTPSTPPAKVTRYSWQDYQVQTAYPMEEREAIQIDEGLLRTCLDETQKPAWQLEHEAKENNAQKGSKAPLPDGNRPDGGPHLKSSENSTANGAEEINGNTKPRGAADEDYKLPI